MNECEQDYARHITIFRKDTWIVFEFASETKEDSNKLFCCNLLSFLSIPDRDFEQNKREFQKANIINFYLFYGNNKHSLINFTMAKPKLTIDYKFHLVFYSYFTIFKVI